jgi:hypothetical protein
MERLNLAVELSIKRYTANDKSQYLVSSSRKLLQACEVEFHFLFTCDAQDIERPTPTLKSWKWVKKEILPL